MEPGPIAPPIPPECIGTVTVTAIDGISGSSLNGVLIQADDCGWHPTAGGGQVVLLRREGATFTLRAVQSDFGLGDPGHGSGSPYHRIVVDELHGLSGTSVALRFEVRGHVWAGWVQGVVTGGTGGPIRLYGKDVGPFIQPTAVGTAGAFDIHPSWSSNQGTLDVVLRAFEQDDAGPSFHDVRYGEQAITIPGVYGVGYLPPYPDASVALAPVSEAVVTGEVVVPPELASAGVSVREWLRSPQGDLLLRELPSVPATPSVPLDLPFPVVPGLGAWIGASSQDDGGQSWHERRVEPPAPAVVLDLHPPPVSMEPPSGSAFSTATAFRWAGGSDGGHSALKLECFWDEPIPNAPVTRAVHYSATIESDGAEATVPALADGGSWIAPNARCTWTVAWQPDGAHLGATMDEADASSRVGAESGGRAGTFSP